MAATFVVTQRPEIDADVTAVRNNLLYAVYERKYKREFNVFVTSADGRATEVEVLTTSGIPLIGDAHPYDPVALCIKVTAKKNATRRTYWRVVAEYDTSWIVNSVTDNPLNQLPEVSYDGPAFDRALIRDYFGIDVVNSSKRPFDPPLVIDDNRGLLRVTRNEASFDEAYARTWRRKLNKTAFGGDDSVKARINSITASNALSNRILYWQITYEIEFRTHPDDSFLPFVQDKGFTKPDGTTITKGTADGVALGVAPYTAECSIYAANEYISYAVEAGVIDTDGDWYVRSVVYFGTVKYVGKNALMKVFA